MKKSLRLLIPVTILLQCFSCEKENDKYDLQLIEGVVMYMAPPDNCNDYVIKADKSYYKPLDLSVDFEIDSLLIRFAYDSTEYWHNCGFGGPIPVIDLTHIENR